MTTLSCTSVIAHSDPSIANFPGQPCGSRERVAFHFEFRDRLPFEGTLMTCGCESTKPIVCSLGPEDLRQRLTVIRELNRRALRGRERDGLQLKLAYDADAEAEVRELVAMERRCCSFLDFRMNQLVGRFLVTITAPTEAADSIEKIFSEFTA